MDILDLNTFKSLLGLTVEDTSKDSVLKFILSNVQEIILNYCHIEELPSGLTFTAYRMAVDLYRNEQLGAGETEKPVSSLSEGDTSVGFSSSIYETSFTDSLLKRYDRQLSRYRRILW